MNSKKRGTSQNSIRILTRGAMIATLYTVLTYLSSLFGLSGGVIQFRISEMLCVLPVFMPEAVLGLFVGCIISNLVTGALVYDVIFGSIATLIGAFGAYLLRGLPEKIKWISTLPTVLSNAVIIPFVLMYVYNSPDSYFFMMLTVGIGEFVCATFGGAVLYYCLKRRRIR